MIKKLNIQTIGWFWDIYNRDILEINPPYRRRSVWNQMFKGYFIDTILQNYPAPAIFLYEEVNSVGFTQYHVVDGGQRLTAIFEFIHNEFGIPETTEKQV